MFALPPGFVTTKYPQYYWDNINFRLYSTKKGNTLRPLKRQTPNKWNEYKEGYTISVDGCRKFLSIDYLKSLPTVTVGK